MIEIPRFFPDNAPMTVRDTMRAPLCLENPPFAYIPFSPTPLDPHLLQVHGTMYNDLARNFMYEVQEKAHRARFGTDEQVSRWVQERLAQLPAGKMESLNTTVVDKVWWSVLDEVVAQHELKQQRNDDAVRALRGDDTPVTPQQAEELMQLRSGIATPEVALRFLARHPELGGIELMKATCTFQPGAAYEAHQVFAATLAGMGDEMVVTSLDEAPYRRIAVENPQILVLKTRLAEVAYRGVQMEVVRRDSGILVPPPRPGEESTSYVAAVDGPRLVYVSPIQITVYGRMHAEPLDTVVNQP
jgi:hypothetical protein